MPETDARRLARTLAPFLPLALGSLRVWGDWFGKPLDNDHTAVGVDSDADALVLRFDEGEVLTVVGPSGWAVDPQARPREAPLRIALAQRVVWQWYAYGRPRTAEHRHREEHWLEDGRIRASSTADWYTPTFAPDPSLPAVEFL